MKPEDNSKKQQDSGEGIILTDEELDQVTGGDGGHWIFRHSVMSDGIIEGELSCPYCGYCYTGTQCQRCGAQNLPFSESAFSEIDTTNLSIKEI